MPTRPKQKATIVSLRDSILSINDIASELLEVPEWDCTIEVRAMDGATRATLLKQFGGETTNSYESIYPNMVIIGCYDPETNARIFTDNDAPLLLTKSAGVLERVAKKVMEVSGMGEKAVDEAGKSSSASPTDTDAPTLSVVSTSS